MKELEHIELEGVLPFNRFFFRSCYFHQLLACYKYFGISSEIVIGNYLNLYVNDAGRLKTKEIQVFDKETFEALTGIRQIKYWPKGAIQEVLIQRLKKGVPSIIVVDCFYMPFRADTFGKIHTDHYISVYGYDSIKKVFIILEHESEKDFRYVRHEFTETDLENAYQGGVRCLQQRRDPFVTFEKLHDPDKDYFEKLREQIGAYAKEINESYRVLKKYFCAKEILNKFSNMEKGLYKDLYWQKFRQMHQFTFTYPKLLKEIKKNFLDIINGYKTLFFICDDTGKEEKVKKKIISQIKIICDKEKCIRNWMLYKAGKKKRLFIKSNKI